MVTKKAEAAKAPAKKAAKAAAKPAPKPPTKAEFVEQIAAEFELTKAEAGRVLEFVTDTIKTAIIKSGTLSLSGLGTFKVAKRAARTARNPRTGEEIKVKASKTVRFKPTPTFKDEL